MLQQKIEPNLLGNVDKDKKFSQPNDGPKIPPEEHARSTRKPTSQRSKEPTSGATLAQGSDRISKGNAKRTIATGPRKCKWSVIPTSALVERRPKSKSIDIRPRLWSSSREELVSAYVEIAGSKCVNNISWKLTEMPILILDDDSISLEKVKNTANELCMDVIFIREFVHNPSNSLIEDTPHMEKSPIRKHGNVPTSIDLPQSRTVAPSTTNPPQDEAIVMGHPTESPIEVLNEASLRKGAQVLEPIAHQDTPTQNGVSVTMSAPFQWQASNQQLSPSIVAPTPTFPSALSDIQGPIRNGAGNPDLSTPEIRVSLPNSRPPMSFPPLVQSQINSSEILPPTLPSNALSTVSHPSPWNVSRSPKVPALSISEVAQLGRFSSKPPPCDVRVAQHSASITQIPCIDTPKGNQISVGPCFKPHPINYRSLPRIPKHKNSLSERREIPSPAAHPGHDSSDKFMTDWHDRGREGPKKESKILTARTGSQVSTYHCEKVQIDRNCLDRKGTSLLVEGISFPVSTCPETEYSQTSADVAHVAACPEFGNTPHRPIGSQSVVRIVPNVPSNMPAYSHTPLAKTHQMGHFNLATPIPNNIHHTNRPVNVPTPYSASIPCERGLDQNVRLPNPTLKQKGKRKMTEHASSPDDKPPIFHDAHTHMPPPKKMKFDQQQPSAHARKYIPGINTIACSSKTKIEDFSPSNLSSSSQVVQDRVPNLNGNNSAPDPPSHPIETLNAPTSNVSQPTKSIKHRGRPPKVTKSSQHTVHPQVPFKNDNESPSVASVPRALPNSKPRSRAKPKTQSDAATVVTPPFLRGKNGVPTPIPEELQALVDAYLNSAPVGIFAAGEQIRVFWGLNLARQKEFGYSFMGFYRVSRVWESVLGTRANSGVHKKGADDRKDSVGPLRVQWRFRMRWEPGGEDWLNERDKLFSPWWNPSLKAAGLSVLPQPEMADSDDESTLAYRRLRQHNPNFARRHCRFNQIFFSVLPLHLLAPEDAELPDSALPRGWHCQDCGKLNFRFYFRHRKCYSSYCQQKPEVEGYAFEIDRLRDPQDSLSLSLPLDELPSSGQIGKKTRVWTDRMKTFIYFFGQDMSPKPIAAQHIFTCNSRALQEEASELLIQIQIHVPLRRLPGDAGSNPYFMHFVDDIRDPDRTHSSWNSSHECLLQARELMQNRGNKYGGNLSGTNISISKLEIRAWVTAGNKRASNPLCAKQRRIIIMCLGCEVIMNINPRSSKAWNDNRARTPDLDKLIPMDDSFDLQEDQLHTQPGEGRGTELDPPETEGQAAQPPMASNKGETGSKARKWEEMALSVSLIHGDIVILEGDDFEYSIKRTGTSILLIGS